MQVCRGLSLLAVPTAKENYRFPPPTMNSNHAKAGRRPSLDNYLIQRSLYGDLSPGDKEKGSVESHYNLQHLHCYSHLLIVKTPSIEFCEKHP